MTGLRLHDTYTGAVRDFVPLRPGHASIYLCGATVQSMPHIGHIRSGVAFDVLRRWLAAKGLDGYFEFVFGGDSFARKKPDPLPLLETCRALGTLPARTLMVGDSRNDAEAAHAAGCPVALVSYGYNHGEPIRAVPAAAYLDRIGQLLG